MSQEKPTVKKIVNLGEESFLLVKLPRNFGENDIIGPITVEIEPGTGGGAVCCKQLSWE